MPAFESKSYEPLNGHERGADRIHLQSWRLVGFVGLLVGLSLELNLWSNESSGLLV
jgi:hypothetical protein